MENIFGVPKYLEKYYEADQQRQSQKGKSQNQWCLDGYKMDKDLKDFLLKVIMQFLDFVYNSLINYLSAKRVPA